MRKKYSELKAMICVWILIVSYIMPSFVSSAKDGNETSTDYRFDYGYSVAKDKYKALDIITRKGTFPIPGLANTQLVGECCDCMTPQGICVAGDYILISAYCNVESYKNDLARHYGMVNALALSKEAKHNTHKSVIYVISKSTREYIMTIVLEDSNHVGGLAYDGEYVWIAKSTDRELSGILMSDIENAVMEGQDCLQMNYALSLECGCRASFVTYFEDKLWVGVCNLSGIGTGLLRGFEIEGDSPDEYRLVAVKEVVLPGNPNGAAFAQVDGETCLVVNTSYGRTTDTKACLYGIDMESTSDINKYTKYGTMELPPMGEEICIDGSDVYTLFESAATPYSFVEHNTCSAIVDRVCVAGIEDWFYWVTTSELLVYQGK